MQYESVRVHEPEGFPGVRLHIYRISFARRAELARRVRDLAARLEFAQAGDSVNDQMDAALLAIEIDRMYIAWGVARVEGLTIDGEPATPDLLGEKGPEPLAREAVRLTKAECGLTEEERKN